MKINSLIDLSSKNENPSSIFKIKYCLPLIKKTVSKKLFVSFSSSLLIMISSCAFDDGYSGYVPNKPRSLNYNNPVSFFTESQTAISSILGSVADTATIRSLIFYLYNFTNALSLVITLSSFGPRSSSPTQ